MRVLYAFFCDDLRQESSGQTTAVGIWGPRLNIREFPAHLKSIAFHAYVENVERTPLRFRLKIALTNSSFDPPPFEGLLEPAAHMIGHNINAVLGPVEVREPGVFAVHLSFANNDGVNIQEGEYQLEVAAAPRPSEAPVAPRPES